MAGCSWEHGSGVLCHFKFGVVAGEKFARECVRWIITDVFSFSDDIGLPTGGLKTNKEIARTIFGQKIFKLEEFAQIGMIGSHSIRNFAATHARRCVELKDEKGIQGRWKGKGQVSDVYNDVELPYPDCKVAEKLAMGGPVST